MPMRGGYCRLIRQTQFPYTGAPTTIEAACLRDADLLMLNEPDAFDWAFVRLYGEAGGTIQKADYWHRQVDFISNLENLLTTNAAKQSYATRMQEISLPEWYKRFMYGNAQDRS